MNLINHLSNIFSLSDDLNTNIEIVFNYMRKNLVIFLSKIL